MISAARTGLSLTRQSVFHNYVAMLPHRMLSMHKIDDNMYLCTDKPRKIEVDKKTFRLTQAKDNTKPIVMMISWFYGKPSQINKYATLYTDNGMDVLVARISLIQFLFAINSVEKFGENILEVLQSNESHYPEIYIHSFSVASGIWGVSQRMLKRNVDKYGKIPSRVIGQVWDSMAHTSRIVVAIPFALFPTNKPMRSVVKSMFWFHTKLYKGMWAHYLDALDNFRGHLARAPALIFASKIDPIGIPSFAEEIKEKWEANGVDVTYKCFEDSEHVKHYMKYPDEYLRLLHENWKLSKLLERK